MKNNKILPRILIVILSLTLISTLILSSVYARYVTRETFDPYSAYPAAFDFDVKFSDHENLQASFALDGYPGNPIGHSRNELYYDFYAQTCNSEVAVTLSFTFKFNAKIADKIRAARANLYADGVVCDYELRMRNSSGVYETMDASKGYTIVENGFATAGQPMTSVISVVVPAKTNPDGTQADYAAYRLYIKTYNNTLMPVDGNTEDYFLATNSIEMLASATQVDSGFVGSHVKK